jgi:hypothetical protein
MLNFFKKKNISITNSKAAEKEANTISANEDTKELNEHSKELQEIMESSYKKGLEAIEIAMVFIAAVIKSDLPNLTEEQVNYKLSNFELRAIDECIYYARFSTILLFLVKTANNVDEVNGLTDIFFNQLVKKCKEL